MKSVDDKEDKIFKASHHHSVSVHHHQSYEGHKVMVLKDSIENAWGLLVLLIRLISRRMRSPYQELQVKNFMHNENQMA
jgi:hypothetical protein